MPKIQLKTIRVMNFDPKTSIANIEISFINNNSQQKIVKEYHLKNPSDLIFRLFIDIKSTNKILFEDPRLSPVELLERYSPILIEDEEKVEEKVYHFLKTLCEKATYMRTSRDATKYMRMFDEFKTASLIIEKN